MTPSPRQTLKKGTHRLSRGCLMWGEEKSTCLLADGADKISHRLHSNCPCGSLTRLGGVSTVPGVAS